MTAAGDALAAVRAAGGADKVVLPDRLRVNRTGASAVRFDAAPPRPETLNSSISLTKGALRQTDTCGARDEGRATIVKPEGGALRRWSEALARLDTGRPPGGVRVDGKSSPEAGQGCRPRGSPSR